jgi:hypothetical protein
MPVHEPRLDRSRSLRVLSRGARCGLLVGVLAGAMACGNDEAAPVTAARAFAAAIPSGDTKRILALVDDRARTYLQGAAHRASDQVGGRRNIEVHEMLQVVDVDPRFQVAVAELIEADEHEARVRLMGVDGTEHELRLVHEDNAWKVSIPVPPAPPSSET